MDDKILARQKSAMKSFNENVNTINKPLIETFGKHDINSFRTLQKTSEERK